MHLERPRGHAFISYVHNDSDRVDKLVEALEDAGVKVWRDKDDIAPGQDWRAEIRRAITEGALAFVACFSANYERREKTFQNEELILAAEQMRLRPLGRTWYIPIRFDECGPPEYDIGAGRTLRSIQHLDLFEHDWERAMRRLLSVVVRALSSGPLDLPLAATPLTVEPESPLKRAREIILEPTRRLQLEDIYDDAVEDLREKLSDESLFPTVLGGNDNLGHARFIADQAHRYIEASRPLAELLAMGCASGGAQHEPLWGRSVQNVANSRTSLTGVTALVQLRFLPLIFLVYSACVAAMTRKDFGVIRAVTLDAKYTNNYNERHPLIGALHTLAPFEGLTAIATIVANESGGTRLSDDDVGKYLEGRLSRRSTPVSDYIHDELRPMFRRPLPDDSDYSDVFDSVEVYLGMLATYEAQRAKEAGSYLHGAWYGSFTWRNRYGYGESIESRLGREAASPDWPGRKAGLLVGPSESVNKAIDDFVKSAKEIRSRSL